MVDGQRTDDGPWLYYKLTNEPKRSGELKMTCVPSEDSDQSDESLCCPHEETLDP